MRPTRRQPSSAAPIAPTRQAWSRPRPASEPGARRAVARPRTCRPLQSTGVAQSFYGAASAWSNQELVLYGERYGSTSLFCFDAQQQLTAVMMVRAYGGYRNGPYEPDKLPAPVAAADVREAATGMGADQFAGRPALTWRCGCWVVTRCNALVGCADNCARSYLPRPPLHLPERAAAAQFQRPPCGAALFPASDFEAGKPSAQLVLGEGVETTVRQAG